MKSGLALACALILSLFLSSCGEALCERAYNKLDECSGIEPAPDLCGALSECADCSVQVKAYAGCVVDAKSCGDITTDCYDEVTEMTVCMTDQGCIE